MYEESISVSNCAWRSIRLSPQLNRLSIECTSTVSPLSKEAWACQRTLRTHSVHIQCSLCMRRCDIMYYLTNRCRRQ